MVYSFIVSQSRRITSISCIYPVALHKTGISPMVLKFSKPYTLPWFYWVFYTDSTAYVLLSPQLAQSIIRGHYIQAVLYSVLSLNLLLLLLDEESSTRPSWLSSKAQPEITICHLWQTQVISIAIGSMSLSEMQWLTMVFQETSPKVQNQVVFAK